MLVLKQEGCHGFVLLCTSLGCVCLFQFEITIGVPSLSVPSSFDHLSLFFVVVFIVVFLILVLFFAIFVQHTSAFPLYDVVGDAVLSGCRCVRVHVWTRVVCAHAVCLGCGV